MIPLALLVGYELLSYKLEKDYYRYMCEREDILR